MSDKLSKKEFKKLLEEQNRAYEKFIGITEKTINGNLFTYKELESKLFQEIKNENYKEAFNIIFKIYNLIEAELITVSEYEVLILDAFNKVIGEILKKPK